MKKSREELIREAVKSHYGALAGEAEPSCCGPAPCCGAESLQEQTCGTSDPQAVCCVGGETAGSLGCGDPLAFVEIQEGQTVLDLGSGLGVEAIVAARMVGDSGKVIGVDMTAGMIDGARRNAARAGVLHIAEFRLGEIEDMPVDDESVDWIISNCVVNLSTDKERVFQEAFRVLKPGGTMLISDLVSSGLPEEVREDLTSWAQCLGGTIEESEYLALIRKAGFQDVAVLEKVDVSAPLPGGACCSSGTEVGERLRVDSIKVKATKAAHD